MKILIQITILLLFCMAPLCSAQPLVPQIKVWGQYTSQVRPDSADLTVKITGKGHCAKAAEQLYKKYLDSILKVLKDFKISGEAICLDGPYTALDGTVSSVLTVRLAVFSKLPGLIQSLSSRPGSRVEHLAWFHSQAAQLNADALAMAITDARQKAEVMARTLGSRLAEALLVNTVDADDQKPEDGKPIIRIEKKVEVVFRLVPGPHS